MVPIYYIKSEFYDYANNVKTFLDQNNIYAEVFSLNGKTINELISSNPKAYKIIIGSLEVQTNSLCIRKNPSHCDNIMFNDFGNYLHNFLVAYS